MIEMNQACLTAVPPRDAASPKSTWVQSSTRPQEEKRAADLGTLVLSGSPHMTVTHLSGSQGLPEGCYTQAAGSITMETTAKSLSSLTVHWGSAWMLIQVA